MDETIVIVIIGAVALFLIILLTTIGLYCWKRSTKKIESEPLLRRDEETGISIANNKRNSVASPPIASTPKTNPEVDRRKVYEEIKLLAQMFIRGVPYKDMTFMPEMGSRSDKFYFLVEKDPQGGRYIMTMTKVGARSLVTGENKLSIKKTLESINHPFIANSYDCDYLKDRNMFVCFRTLYKETLKDLLNKSKPTDKYARKYTALSGKGLSEKKIAKFGRQILEGLIYFKTQKFPFYHLTASNVILDENGVCRLTDYENDILGVDIAQSLASIIYPHVGKTDPVVIAFGAVIYEMAMGFALDSPNLDDLPNTVHPKIRKVLQTIFKPTEAAPSLEDLAKVPFFADVQLYSPWSPQPIATDAKSQQLLAGATESVLETLKNPPTKNKRRPTKSTKLSTSSSNVTGSKSKPTDIASTPTSPNTTAKVSSSAPVPSSVPPPPPPAPKVSASDDSDRSALLGSIEGFNSKKLKKTVTNDRSAPKV